MVDPEQIAEKYTLAQQTALAEKPDNGLCGFELEWNLLDSQLRPLLTVGSGPSRQSFVDYLRAECLAPWLRDFSQLEVFHWMIEWATRPYYSPRGAVYEGRLMEATLHNALHRAGQRFGEHLYAWHGNLLFLTGVGPDSVPGNWHLAKRRYLQRCIALYGQGLATAGTHTNLSLPEPLLAWDFMHLPAERRSGGRSAPLHLDEYKSEFYITATRLLRAFAALFIAAGASTPLQAQERDGRPVVALTEVDSVRNLTFPNPVSLDQPDLYRSYDDYLAISYDLVRRGVRFGNNNWTPTRARSFAEPVERLILVTSEQLGDLYARGLYAVGESAPVEEMAQQIEVQNLLARIKLPMARIEVRTDDGAGTLEEDIAHLTLKHLLLLRFYADPEFGRAFRYDREDLERARRNEAAASRHGLRAEIEHPLNGKPVGMRAFLRWTLDEVRPLADALGLWEDLAPLVEMAAGAPNAAERLRRQLRAELGDTDEVPLDLLRELAEARRVQVVQDAAAIAEQYPALGEEAPKLGEFLQRAREEVHFEPDAPVRFRPRPAARIEVSYPDKTSEVVALASDLVRIPSVTACPNERLDEVRRAAVFIYDYLRDAGLEVTYYNRSKYPALLAGFPQAGDSGRPLAPVMLSGHFDVVSPEPDDGQFEPRLDGDYLWGRGAADMKTVVATYLVWLKDRLRAGPPYPPVNLLLIGNEENGESEPMGTPHVLAKLAQAHDGYAPGLLIAGERTGERGDQLWGQVCTENRGVLRFQIEAHGRRGHTGVSGAAPDLAERLLAARSDLAGVLDRHLTLQGEGGWQSQARFPYIQVGEPGVYNVTPAHGLLGVEVRPIPQDDVTALLAEVEDYCRSHELDLQVPVRENGVAADPGNPYLQALLAAVEDASGQPAVTARKLPGTSARFAPAGQGVVWGQSGLGPHARDERHYLPSIAPYYRALDAFAARLLQAEPAHRRAH